MKTHKLLISTPFIFSPDGKTLISGGKDGVVRTWNATPKSRKADSLIRPPDVKWWALRAGILICTHTNGTISYRDTATLRRIAEYPWPEEHRTNSVSRCHQCIELADDFTPSGKLAWANKQNEIVVWDLAAERQIARVKWVPGDEKVLKISPDEKLLAGIAGEGLTIWDLEHDCQVIVTLPRSPDAMFYTDDAMNFSHDNHLLAAGNWDGQVEVWDLNRKKRVATWPAHQVALSGVSFLPDGKRLVTVSFDAAAKLWEIETQQELKQFSRTRNNFYSLTVAPDGQRIAAGGESQFIKIWNGATGREVATLKTRAAELVQAVQFLPPDGNTLVSLTSRELRIWRAPSWEEIAAAESKQRAAIKQP